MIDKLTTSFSLFPIFPYSLSLGACASEHLPAALTHFEIRASQDFPSTLTLAFFF